MIVYKHGPRGRTRFTLVDLLEGANPHWVGGRDPSPAWHKGDRRETITVRLTRHDIARIVRALKKGKTK